MRELTDEEKAILDEHNRRLTEWAKRPLTAEDLLAQWQRAVQEVESGYPASIDEYLFDLSQVRDLLEKFMTDLPETLQTKLRVRVDELDGRFVEATIPDTNRRLEEVVTPGSGYWWTRVPRHGPLAKVLLGNAQDGT
jgi:hypothetical protein